MCDSATIPTVALAILGGSAVGWIGGHLLYALDMALAEGHARRDTERRRRIIHPLAYAAEDLPAGVRVMVSLLQPEAYRVPDDLVEQPDGNRVHTVVQAARRGQLVRLGHPDLIQPATA